MARAQADVRAYAAEVRSLANAMRSGGGADLGLKLQAAAGELAHAQRETAALRNEIRELGASGSEFSKLNEAIKKPLEGLAQFKSSLRETAELAGAMFAIDKLSEFTREMAEAGEQALKMSSILGTSVEEFSQFSNELAVVGANAETAGRTLERLQRNVAQALADPTQRAALAFKALGISMEELAARQGNAAALFDLTREKLAAFGDGANKTAIAYAIMGRSFDELAPVLRKSSAELEEYKARLADTGAAMTTEFAHKAEETGESLRFFSLAIQGAKQAAFDELQPALTGLTDSLTQLTEAMKDDIDEGGALYASLEVLAEAVRVVETWFTGMAIAVEATGAALASWGHLFVSTGEAASQAAHGDFTGAWKTLAKAFDDDSASADKLTDHLTDLVARANAAQDVRPNYTKGQGTHRPQAPTIQPPGAGAGESRVAEWRQQLDAQLAAEKHYFGSSTAEELQFWQQKKAAAEAGWQALLAQRQKDVAEYEKIHPGAKPTDVKWDPQQKRAQEEEQQVDRQIYELQKTLAKQELDDKLKVISEERAARLAELDYEQAAAKGNLTQIAAIEQQRLAIVKQSIADEEAARGAVRAQMTPEERRADDAKNQAAETTAATQALRAQQQLQDEKRSAQMAALENQRKVLDQQEAAELAAVQHQIRMGQLTVDAAAADEEQIVNAHAAAAARILAIEGDLAQGDIKLSQEVADRKAELAQQTADKITSIQDKAQEEELAKAKEIDSQLAQSLSQAIMGVFTGHETWGQALQKMIQGYEEKALDAGLKSLFDNLGVGQGIEGLENQVLGLFGIKTTKPQTPEEKLAGATTQNTTATEANTAALKGLAPHPGGAAPGTPGAAPAGSPAAGSLASGLPSPAGADAYLAQLDQQNGLPKGFLEGVQQGESSGGTNLGYGGAFGITKGWAADHGVPFGSFSPGTTDWQKQAQGVGQFFAPYATSGNLPAGLQAYTGKSSPPNAAYASIWGSGGGSSGNLESGLGAPGGQPVQIDLEQIAGSQLDAPASSPASTAAAASLPPGGAAADSFPNLFANVPQLAGGGTIAQSGLAVVHAGETVSPPGITTQPIGPTTSPVLQPTNEGPNWGVIGGVLGGIGGLALLSGLLKGSPAAPAAAGQAQAAQTTTQNTTATQQNTQALQALTAKAGSSAAPGAAGGSAASGAAPAATGTAGGGISPTAQQVESQFWATHPDTMAMPGEPGYISNADIMSKYGGVMLSGPGGVGGWVNQDESIPYDPSRTWTTDSSGVATGASGITLPAGGGNYSDVPGFDSGGTITGSGLAVVHAGETIVPAESVPLTTQNPGFTPTTIEPANPQPNLAALLGIAGGIGALALLSGGLSGNSAAQTTATTTANTTATTANTTALNANTAKIGTAAAPGAPAGLTPGAVPPGTGARTVPSLTGLTPGSVPAMQAYNANYAVGLAQQYQSGQISQATMMSSAENLGASEAGNPGLSQENLFPASWSGLSSGAASASSASGGAAGGLSDLSGGGGFGSLFSSGPGSLLGSLQQTTGSLSALGAAAGMTSPALLGVQAAASIASTALNLIKGVTSLISGGFSFVGGLFKGLAGPGLFSLEGGGVIPSAAGGLRVQDGKGGQMFIGHPGETVLPADLSRGFQDIIQSHQPGRFATQVGALPSADRGWTIPSAPSPHSLSPDFAGAPRAVGDADRNASGGAGVHHHYHGDSHVHVHAMDSHDVRRVLLRNGGAVAEALMRQGRNFNPNVRT